MVKAKGNETGNDQNLINRLNEAPSIGMDSVTSGQGDSGQKKKNYSGVLVFSMIRIIMGFNPVLNGPFLNV